MTLGLIVGLKLLDTRYRVFERVTSTRSTRARVLENELNMDITNTISKSYAWGNWGNYVHRLYLSFVALTTLLGVAVLYPAPIEVLLMISAGVVAGWLVDEIHGRVASSEDWKLEHRTLGVKDPLKVTLTNLRLEELHFEKGEIPWWIEDPSRNVVYKYVESVDFYVLSMEVHNWSWEHDGLKPGLYWFVARSKASSDLAFLVRLQRSERFSTQRIPFTLTEDTPPSPS